MKTETVQAGTFVHEALSDPVYQGFQIFRWGFVVAPLIAGIDKILYETDGLDNVFMATVGQFGRQCAQVHDGCRGDRNYRRLPCGI
jgi:hypothetical protein